MLRRGGILIGLAQLASFICRNQPASGRFTHTNHPKLLHMGWQKSLSQEYNKHTLYNDHKMPKISLVTRDQIKAYVRLVEYHRMLVYAISKTIYPEYDFVTHDLSKFSPEELEPYTIKFIQHKLDEENPYWQSALQHHYENNPHHPQYWKDKPMPEQFLKESIVDMLAAKFQYEDRRETLDEHLTAEMFELRDVFLERYIVEDRIKVKIELNRLQAMNWTNHPVTGRCFSDES